MEYFQIEIGYPRNTSSESNCIHAKISHRNCSRFGTFKLRCRNDLFKQICYAANMKTQISKQKYQSNTFYKQIS